jgi:hypothetical protein
MTCHSCHSSNQQTFPSELNIHADSQSSNPGSIPGSATKLLPLSPVLNCISADAVTSAQKRHITSCGTVAAEEGHNPRSPFVNIMARLS